MNIDNVLASTNISTAWSMQVALIIIGRYAIQVKNAGIAIPISGFTDFSLTDLLATTSLGHVLGAGTILGLKSIDLIN